MRDLLYGHKLHVSALAKTCNSQTAYWIMKLAGKIQKKFFSLDKFVGAIKSIYNDINTKRLFDMKDCPDFKNEILNL